MRHSQGLAIVASLWVSRPGSVKAIQRVQLRESTPLLLACETLGCYQAPAQVATETLRRA
jgi:hypothetical protein